ncbi:MAG: DoxX family protein, partial [Weeksellaceae bacterium]
MKTTYKNIDLGLLILRISIGGLMLFHGINKLQAPIDTANYMVEVMKENGLPGFMGYGVFLGEIIAPILVLIGWRTKIFAPI